MRHGSQTTSPTSAVDDVISLFTDRGHGNMSASVGEGDVVANRDALRASLGATDLVFMDQVHGADVAVVDSRHDVAGTPPRADALVTTEVDLALAVLVADCVPLLLAADGVVAVVHAGRAGVAADVVGATLDAMRSTAGVRPEDVSAVIGPAIGPCCYEVPAAMAAEVAATTGLDHIVGRTTADTPSLDLPGAVAAQLGIRGVRRVDRAGACTRCHADRWFSHRATGSIGAPAGRQVGVAMRRGTP